MIRCTTSLNQLRWHEDTWAHRLNLLKSFAQEEPPIVLFAPGEMQETVHTLDACRRWIWFSSNPQAKIVWWTHTGIDSIKHPQFDEDNEVLYLLARSV